MALPPKGENMKKNLSVILVMLITVCSVFIYTQNIKNNDKAEKGSLSDIAEKYNLSEITNNDADADSLIKTLYEHNDVQTHRYFDEQLESMPAECIRQNNDTVYIVYKFTDGSYFFMKYIPIDGRLYLGEFLDSRELVDYDAFIDSIEFNTTTSDEIKKFSPYSTHWDVASGYLSCHYTNSGKYILLSYKDKENKHIVTKKTETENNIMTNMLPIDRQLLNG